MKIIKCDACDEEFSLDQLDQFLTLNIPAGITGEEALEIDLCSVYCLSVASDALAQNTKQDEPEEEPEADPEPPRTLRLRASGAQAQIGTATAPTPGFRALTPEESEMMTGVRRKW